ncbi:hypothetical protein WDW86_10775 [Bdellovibrionota bacterium FG-2]
MKGCSNGVLLSILITIFAPLTASGTCPLPQAQPFEGIGELSGACQTVATATLSSSGPVFETLQDSINAQLGTKGKPERTPVRTIDINLAGKDAKFPVFAKSKATFFRAAVINRTVDDIILKDGWKSGYLRGEMGSALPPQQSLAARAIEYARVKGDPRPFPKGASVVGVISEDPIRPASVVYHTGMDSHSADSSKYIRLDEIEIGPEARDLDCRNVPMVNTTEAFKKAGKQSRFSTEGEFVVDLEIPSKCIVAIYRVRFQKVDDTYYSDKNSYLYPSKKTPQ